MNLQKEEAEKAVWRLFRRLNPNSEYSYFRKSERPDFRNGNRGVELCKFIQDFYNNPDGGDHGWECRYQIFSRICNDLWGERYPGRPLPISVGYVPHSKIRELKGRVAFRHQTMKECAAEFVAFAASAERSVTLNDERVAEIGQLMGRYFQLIDVTPFKARLSKLENWHYKRTPGWRYPQSAGGISVGSRVEEIVKRKASVVAKYPCPFTQMDLLLYADAQTLASRLMPWAESELRGQPVDHGPFKVIWLLDVPGRKLMRAVRPVSSREDGFAAHPLFGSLFGGVDLTDGQKG